MHKLLELILKLLTIGILFYPIGQMAFVSTLCTFALAFKGLSTGFRGVGFEQMSFFLVCLGGFLGSIGLLLSLFSVKTKPVICFLISGFISYSVIVYSDPFRGPFLEQVWENLPLVIAVGFIYVAVIHLREKAANNWVVRD